MEYQRKENLQRKPEVLRERPVEVPLRPPSAWIYGRVLAKSYLRRYPAIIVEGMKKHTNMLNLWCGLNPLLHKLEKLTFRSTILVTGFS